MIKIYTYINFINNNFNFFKSLKFVKFERNFKNNIFSLLASFKITKFKRKVFIRRKHLYNWLQYINILSDWSSEYRFFKKYVKYILNRNFFKFSYLIFNFVFISSKYYKFCKNIHYFCGVGFKKKIEKYFFSSFFNKSSSLSFKFISFFNISSYKMNPTLFYNFKIKVQPFFYKTSTDLLPFDINYTKFITYNFFTKYTYINLLKILKEFYKIFILLNIFFVYNWLH